ncbi:unknown [Prevotella sp. CAG:1058]|nr:unknown [Prevotella sp. CAG:1058]
MSRIGIYGLFVRTKFRVCGVLVHVPIVLQAAVVAHAEDGVAVVKYHVSKRLVLVRVIPKRHHHVLHTLVNTSHNVREHIVVAKVIHIKIVGQFGFEFRSIVLGGLYPRYNSLQIGWNFRAGLILGIDVVIIREACLKHFHPIRCAVIPFCSEVIIQEHSHRVVVVQELPAFRRVLSAELLRHPFLVVVARYVQEAKHGLGALVVVEVELAQELRGFLQRTAVKQVARLAVNRRAHIIGVAAVAMLLRRGQFPGRRQDVLHQLGHTGVVRAGTFREVGLQAEAVHRRGLFLVAACRAEGVFRLFLQLAAHTLLVTAEVQVAGHLRGVLEVDAVVLYRIGKRACALQADAAAHTAEVQRLAALHHAQHLVHVVLRVLVVVHRRLQHRGHAVVLPSGDDDVPHAVRHAVDCYVAAVVDHVVAVVQGHHAVRAVLVYHVGLKHLRVAQVRVVGTHEVHVGGRAVRAKFNI